MTPINRRKGRRRPWVLINVDRVAAKYSPIMLDAPLIRLFVNLLFCFLALRNIKVVRAQAKQSGTLRYASFEKIMCVGKIDANAAAVRATFLSEKVRTI